MAVAAAEGSSRTSSSRPQSQKSTRSARSSRSRLSSKTTEETPLLSRESRYHSEDDHPNSDGEHTHSLAESSLLRSLHTQKPARRKRRWPSILALLLLFVAVVLILCFRFFVPGAVEEYAKQALDFRPTSVVLDSFTDTGAMIRVEADVMLDASKVDKASTRNLGRFATWIVREVESGPADVSVYLPDYDNALVGTAKIPGVKMNVRNGHVTHLNVLAAVEPSSFDAIRTLANDWLHGRLSQLRVLGKAVVPLRSGIINVGNRIISHELPMDDALIPSLPTKNFNVSELHVYSSGGKGVSANATVSLPNDSIFNLEIPPVGFDILVDNCLPSDRNIQVANGSSGEIVVKPKTDIQITATADVKSIPEDLTKKCKGTDKSPLDVLSYYFSHGRDVPVYVRCCHFPDPRTPKWAIALLEDIVTVPYPFPGQNMDHLLKNFTLANTKFYLPDPLAEPGTPEAQPKISAKIQALVAVPEKLDFPLGVSRVRADTMVYHKKKELGKLDLSKWQKANSTIIDAHDDDGPMLLVESLVDKAPIEILDDDVFTEVVQALVFGGKSVVLEVQAAVDVEVNTPVGILVVKQIPAEGTVPLKPIRKGGKGGKDFESLKPSVQDLQIVGTTPDSVTIQARINFTNPTNYSATVPYVNVNILANDTVLGHAIAENVEVVPGRNRNITVRAIWEPFVASGEAGKAVGRELISQYLSGYNTTLTFQTHSGTIPSQPSLGKALSRFPISIPAPHLHTPNSPSDPPGDGDGDGDDPDNPSDPDAPEDTAPHFIRYATLHVLGSTAVFTLASPLNQTTIYIEHVDATALYHNSTVGRIRHDLPFAVPPGDSDTPRLPVDWSLGSAGYEAIRKAIGGQLHVNASAEIGFRIGRWRESVWYKGKGIGAHVRL